VRTQPILVFVTPEWRFVFVRQEQPYHPPSLFQPGLYISLIPPPPPPPPPFVVGRLVILLANEPVLQDRGGTRHVVFSPDSPVFLPARTTRYVILQERQSMQLPSLLQYGPTGPMDNEPFTADASAWVATVQGDSILSAVPAVLNTDQTPQSDVSITAVVTAQNLMTVWLTGGVVGNNYLVQWHITTTSGRSDYKYIGLSVVANRS
jgi:hypothetical protein